MTVSLVSWRAVIGIFNCRISVMSKNCESYLVNNFTSLIESSLLFYHYFESAYISLFTLLYIFALLQCHGDIELNPGPKKLRNKSISVCHWNLNSLMAHNYSKLTQLKAYTSMYKHDFICLSETYLDSSTPDSLLEIDGYNLIRADHPDNSFLSSFEQLLSEISKRKPTVSILQVTLMQDLPTGGLMIPIP